MVKLTCKTLIVKLPCKILKIKLACKNTRVKLPCKDINSLITMLKYYLLNYLVRKSIVKIPQIFMVIPCKPNK